jgi:hypothetical protein
MTRVRRRATNAFVTARPLSNPRTAVRGERSIKNQAAERISGVGNDVVGTTLSVFAERVHGFER